MPVPPKTDPVKFCATCGRQMTRKRYGARLEDRGVFLRRNHCSLACANTREQVTKSAHHWRARKHRTDACTTCGALTDLHVHHRDRDPANNDPANLLTLCSSCHLKLHWQEDRAARMAAARRAVVTAASRGVLTRPRSADGRFVSVDQHLTRPSQPGETAHLDSAHILSSS